MKTAAHQIGVNLIRKRSSDWFGKEKWHRWHRQPPARVNRKIWIKTWPFNRAEMIVFSREKTREKREKTTLLFFLSSRRFEAFIEVGNLSVPTPLLMLSFNLLVMIKAVTGFHQGKKHTLFPPDFILSFLNCSLHFPLPWLSMGNSDFALQRHKSSVKQKLKLQEKKGWNREFKVKGSHINLPLNS